MRHMRLLAAAAALLAASPLSAEAGGIEVVHPWARPTIEGRPGAAYLGIHNAGQADDRLVGARAEGVEAIEMHVVETVDDVVGMRRVEAIDVPAGGMVHLGPGGAHLMLLGLDAPLEEGGSLSVTLVFQNAGEVESSFAVTRVSSHSTTSASRSAASARGDRSPRLPIGVATRCNPGVSLLRRARSLG